MKRLGEIVTSRRYASRGCRSSCCLLPGRCLARERDHHRRLVDGIAIGQRAEGLNLGRPAEQIALRLIAQLVLEELELGVSFHTLGEHVQIERTAKTAHPAP